MIAGGVRSTGEETMRSRLSPTAALSSPHRTRICANGASGLYHGVCRRCRLRKFRQQLEASTRNASLFFAGKWLSVIFHVRCGRPESYLHCITYLVSYFVLHTGLVSSFGGCMAQASYFDTARRPVSFLAKKARFVTTSKVRSCHKAIQSVGGRSGRVHEYACDCSR